MASWGFAHLSGGSRGSSAENPANFQCVVVGSCAKSTQENTESRKTLEQKFIFQIGTLNPNGINEHFSFN